MTDYEENTLDQLGDMNYKVKLEEIGIRARPIRTKDLVTNNKFSKEMLDTYGRLYNQPIETIDPASGEVVLKKYQRPTDLPDLETIDPLLVGYDPRKIEDNNLIIKQLNTIIIDYDDFNKYKEENYSEYLTKKDNLALLIDKKNILEERINSFSNKERSKPATKKIIEKILKDIQAINIERKNLKNEIYEYDNDIIEVDIPNIITGKVTPKEFNDIIVNQLDILRAENETELLKEDDATAEKQRVAKINRERIRKHQDVLNTLNSGAFKMEQAQGESEEEYLQRLDETASQPYNENMYFNASIDSIEKLKKNMKDVTTNLSLAEGVVVSLKPEERFLVNKYWGDIKFKLLRTYGYNNKSISSVDYIETIDKILNEKEIEVKRPEGGTEEITGEELTSFSGNKIETLADYDIIQQGNIIKVTSNITNNTIYIKLGDISSSSKRKKVVLISFTDDLGSFNVLLEPHSTNVNQKERERLKLIDFKTLEIILGSSTRDILRELFNIKEIKPNTTVMIWDYLADRYTLETNSRKVPIKNEAVKNNLVGWGVNNDDDIPKLVPLGNVLILLNKLYYKSTLSIKDSKNHNIEGFISVKVSEPFVNIIMKLFNGEKIKKHDINILPSGEHELYNRLMYISGLKHTNETTIETSIDEIKKRIELVEGEIAAGNNNREYLAELNSLLNKLVNFGVITRAQMKKHIILIEHDFF